MSLNETIRRYLGAWGATLEEARRRKEFPTPVPPVVGRGSLPSVEEEHWHVHLRESRRYLRTIPEWACPVSPDEMDDIEGFAGEAHCDFAMTRRYQFNWRSAYLFVAHDDHPAVAALYRWRNPPSAVAVFNSEHPDRPQLAVTYDRLRKQVGEALLHSRRHDFQKAERGDREPVWFLGGTPQADGPRPAEFPKSDYVRADLSQGTVPARIARLMDRVPHPLTRSEIVWTLFGSVELASGVRGTSVPLDSTPHGRG